MAQLFKFTDLRFGRRCFEDEPFVVSEALWRMGRTNLWLCVTVTDTHQLGEYAAFIYVRYPKRAPVSFAPAFELYRSRATAPEVEQAVNAWFINYELRKDVPPQWRVWK